MSLPADTLLAIADTLGYLQHYLQELTECQNASEYTINTTLTGLTAQLQQLTQLITTPTPIVTSPLIPTSPPPVSPPSLVPSAPSKQWTRHTYGLPTAPSSGADRTTECFRACYKHHSCGPDRSNTTNYLTYDQPCSCTNCHSTSDTHVSASS